MLYTIEFGYFRNFKRGNEYPEELTSSKIKDS